MRSKRKLNNNMPEEVLPDERWEMSERLDDNEQRLKRKFDKCSDFYIRKIVIADSFPILIAFIEGMVDAKHADTALIEPLLRCREAPPNHPDEMLKWLQKECLPVLQTEIVDKPDEPVKRIVNGKIVIMIDQTKTFLSLEIQSESINRQPEESLTETVIRGSHMGFLENIDINIAMIRQRLRTPYLKTEMFTVGHMTKTRIIVAYLENVASKQMVDEIKTRIKRIDTEAVLESGQIEEWISDRTYTIFPLLEMSERPDTVTGFLLEGKVTIFVDGTPMTISAPTTFWEGFQTAEDYYNNTIFSTAIRWLRYLFSFIALLLPSFYVAVTNFHQEMIPTGLALSIAAARQAAPFPTLVEAVMMEITFEVLREAGIRLPTPIGPTISIVGALVIGEAAVQAGIISAPIVIVVALTGIASFLVPKVNMNNAIRLLRFPMILLAGMFGLYGIVIGLLALLIHLVNLHSFGVPYMSPLAPFRKMGALDVLIKAPSWILFRKQRKSKG